MSYKEQQGFSDKNSIQRLLMLIDTVTKKVALPKTQTRKAAFCIFYT